jgi:hypothetical protein
MRIVIPVGQASRSLFEEVVKAITGVDCVDDAVKAGAIGHQGAIHRIGSAVGKGFIIQGDLLVIRNRCGAAVAQLQLGVAAIFRLDDLAFQQHVAFLEDANLAFGIGSGNFSLQITYYSNGSLSHDDLPE